jgi:RNA polymerase sigma-70 factor (ECF subfamily)
LDKYDTEDVSQEVFIEVFQSIKSFRGDSKLSTWIFRIAVTESLDAIRKRNRKKRVSSSGKPLDLDVVSNWISSGEMPDSELIAFDTMNQIECVLNKLPKNQRIAFTLSKIVKIISSEFEISKKLIIE